MRGRILVVDDDRDICRLVKLYLENEGFEVDVAYSGEQALALLSGGESAQPGGGEPRAASGAAGAGSYAMIILDIMLPGIDGFEVARQARVRTDVPILFLSARDADVDKAVGLGIGADDYVTKPFSPIELVARVKAHLRRYNMSAVRSLPIQAENQRPGQGEAARPGDKADEWSILAAGPVRLDLRARRAWVRGVEVELTAKEFDLLALFVSNPGQVFTKAQLFDEIWGEDFIGADNTVMVHIRRLRTKVEADPGDPQLIKTVWGIGYRFEAQDDGVGQTRYSGLLAPDRSAGPSRRGET